jgi:hypothetical protein
MNSGGFAVGQKVDGGATIGRKQLLSEVASGETTSAVKSKSMDEKETCRSWGEDGRRPGRGGLVPLSMICNNLSCL